MKKPARTWVTFAALGIPLLIVGLAAMMITFATLIDVARVNGLPFPQVFPIVVDVGMIASMIVAAQFRLKGISGRWLAYLAFIVLSLVSVLANANHAQQTADLTQTSWWAASLIGAVPSATLLVITHLVMKLIPDEKERQRLQKQREKQQPVIQQTAPMVKAALPEAVTEESVPEASPVPVLRRVEETLQPTDAEIEEKVLEYVEDHDARPTGKIVGDWLGGKSAKTGQRFMQKMEQAGAFDTEARLVSGQV